MNVRILTGAREATAEVATLVARSLRSNPRLVLGLPAGRTPLELYRQLAALHASGRLDFSEATTFNLDEFLGLPPRAPGSFSGFMQDHLFRHVNVAESRINSLDGSAADPDAECRRYEAAIERAGGLDLQVLGVGTNGHLGFNEPAEALHARTHRAVLRPETRQANAALFSDDPERVPAEALTMGMATILQAKSVVLLATGESKAGCIERVIHGPVTTWLPASFLQLHLHADVFLDEAAARLLP